MGLWEEERLVGGWIWGECGTLEAGPPDRGLGGVRVGLDTEDMWPEVCREG